MKITGLISKISLLACLAVFIFCGVTAAAEGASKIIALDPMVSQWLLALKCESGAKDILITEVGKSDYMKDVFPELKDRVMRKKIDNVEELMALNPEIVFIKNGTDHDLSEFKKGGLKISSFDFEKIDDILKGVTAMGGDLKLEKRAEILTAYFRTSVERVRKSIEKSEVKGSKPKVYFANGNIYSSVAKGMYQNFLIESAGGVSVTANSAGAKIQVSAEELIKWDPDIIITASFCSDTPESIMKNEKLKDIAAVKNKKIFVMPRLVTSWDMPVPESLPGIEWLSAKLHPGLATGLNQRIKDFYKTFYNLNVEDAQIEKLINR